MNQHKNGNAYLQHIIDSIGQIEEYTKSIKTEEDFFRNKLVQDAVIRHLEIIGEAAGKISDSIKKAHKSIKWKEIMGMRNKLIHEYFGVNIKYIWFTLKNDLPELKAQIKSIIDNNSPK
ncbi:MAG: DUF86 domain-containing protein [bacterium]|nr:DUF86 domain-containing protein [bacterium]